MNEELKVTDIINIKQKTLDELKAVMTKLKLLSDTYMVCDDLQSLESLKREFLANLQYMASLYAKTKAFKGPNHTYLENAIKRIKGETMDILMSQGMKVTAAEKALYNHDYYLSRCALADSIITKFIEVELKYEQYNATLSAIVQSISVASKEYVSQRMSGS